MTAGAVADLFKERLNVSRSTFYRRFRSLLCEVHLDEGAVTLHTDGRYYMTTRPAAKRFRRREVEALLAYLEREGLEIRR